MRSGAELSVIGFSVGSLYYSDLPGYSASMILGFLNNDQETRESTLKQHGPQKNVPGLEVDLAFKIQAKRLKPSSTLNPKYVRELRGTLGSGDWGLLITTAKVSSKTRQEGLSDSSRVISIVDGQSLIDLLNRYDVGVKTNYQIDLSFLEMEETPSEVPGASEITPQEMLSESLREDFRRLGTSPIYKSQSKIVIARSSKF